MTVAELIELLKQHDPALPVVVAGYEEGYNNLSLVAQVRMVPEADTRWYCGAHQEADDGNEKAMTALLLSGRNHVAKDD